MTGMGKTFIYDRMKDGTFPKWRDPESQDVFDQEDYCDRDIKFDE